MERRAGTSPSLPSSALRLPDETYFIDIPKKKRLRCSSCGRRATEISPNWNEVALYGNGVRRLGEWVVVARMPDGSEVRSSALSSREQAMGLAHDQADVGDTVLRIEGPGGNISGEEVAAERAARNSATARR